MSRYNRFVKEITAEALQLPLEDVDNIVRYNTMVARFMNEIQEGKFTEVFGKDVWSKLENGEISKKNMNKVTADVSVILLGYEARMGKDTSADFIEDFAKQLEECKEDKDSAVKRYSFADTMKDIVSKALGVSRDTLDRMKNDSDYFRGILQRFGSGKVKEWFGNDIWRDKLIQKINIDKENGLKIAIIPDLRFKAEAKNYDNFCTVKVVRKDVVEENKRNNKDVKKHISETEMETFQFDHIINNDGTLEELKQLCEDLSIKHLFSNKITLQDIVKYETQEIPSALKEDNNIKKEQSIKIV